MYDKDNVVDNFCSHLNIVIPTNQQLYQWCNGHENLLLNAVRIRLSKNH